MAFPDEHRFPTDISRTFPVVVTCEDHGFTEGQFIRATNFFTFPPEFATGMYQLNNRLFQVKSPTADTFLLYDQSGEPVDGTGYTAFTNNGLPQFTLTGPSLFMENSGEQP